MIPKIIETEPTHIRPALPSEFSQENMFAIFCMLLGKAGGKVGISDMLLEKFPGGTLDISHDDDKGIWIISLPKPKRKRGIIVPREKQLILSN